MRAYRRALLLTGFALSSLNTAKSQPVTPNQSQRESRREIENSRREARENLDRGVRGEIKPAEVRRPHGDSRASASTISPPVVARWRQMAPQQLRADPDFVRALQNEDPAALAHWEGVLAEMNSDLRAAAGSRTWIGGPVFVPDQNSIEITVSPRERARPPRRGSRQAATGRPPAAGARSHAASNPIQERARLERELREARGHYGEALRRRDEAPGDRDLALSVEYNAAQMRQAEERYQAFLYENSPQEYRARRQELEALEARANNPRMLDSSQLRREPAERPRPLNLPEYDGPQGTNPEHRLRGTPDGRVGPVLPSLRNRASAPQRPAAPALLDYAGPQGTNPEHRMRGTPGSDDGPVLPSLRTRQPAPQRPQTPPLKEYEQPQDD